MTPASFEDIAIQLVKTDRARAMFQVRDIGQRLAWATYETLEQAMNAERARAALIKELFKAC